MSEPIAKAKKYLERLDPHVQALTAFREKYALPSTIEPWLFALLYGIETPDELSSLEVEFDLPLVKEARPQKGKAKEKLEQREVWVEADPDNGIEKPFLWMTDWKLTVAQTAECLGVSENTVFRLAKAHPIMKWDSLNEEAEEKPELIEKGSYSFKNSLLAYRRHLQGLFGITEAQILKLSM
jgi:hypothetical protein